MSLQTFQTILVQLIEDPAFRDQVRANNATLIGDLTERERTRLSQIARDRGLDINRTLHKGFRLGKLRALLPFTCQILGARLGREVSAFWQERPPSSFSFLPEALDFCAFLARRKPRIKYLSEVMAYERATLELEQARTDAPPMQLVPFDHDPHVLLTMLAAGKRPRGIAPQRCQAIGMKNPDGRISWRLNEKSEP